MSIDFRLPTILFGGSFDPVHAGHLHVARETLAALPEFKQFVFVPAAHSPGKAAACASAAQRLEWLRLAARPYGFGVWDIEMARGGESYTVETLEAAAALGAKPATLAWLVGADAYQGLPGWRDSARIRLLCRLLVVDRPGQPAPSQNPQDRFLEIPLHPASSTEIRAKLSLGQSAGDWLPAPVSAALDKLLPGQNPYARNLV